MGQDARIIGSTAAEISDSPGENPTGDRGAVEELK